MELLYRRNILNVNADNLTDALNSWHDNGLKSLIYYNYSTVFKHEIHIKRIPGTFALNMYFTLMNTR